MIPANVKYFPLNSAYLCQACDAVGNDPVHCPACASENLIGLARLLDGAEGILRGKIRVFPVEAA